MHNNLKASASYLFATFFNKGIAFITVPIFTRMLSTEDYGILTTFTSWVDMLTVCLSLALYTSLRNAFVDYKNEIDDYLSTIVSFTIILSILSCLLVIMGGSFTEYGITLGLLAIIQGGINAVFQDYTQYLMMKFKYIERSIFMAMPNLISAFLAIILIYLFDREKYYGKIFATLFISFIFICISLFKIFRNSKPNISKQYLKYGLTISIPLVFHGLSLTLLAQSDRTLLSFIVGPSQTGIYSLTYNFGMIATVFTTAFEGVWLPWFIAKMEKKEFSIINNRAKDYINIMTIIMILVMLIGPEVLKILADERYWEGIYIIPAMVISNYLIFLYSLHVYIEQYYKHTLIICVNTIFAASINIFLNILFIPKYGFYASGVIMIVSYLVSLIMHSISAYRLNKKLLPIQIILFPITLIIISVLIFYFSVDYFIIRFFTCFICSIFFIIKYRKSLKNMIRRK